MKWSDAINQHVGALRPVTIDQMLKMRLVKLLDLTTLNDTDTEASVATFCEKAETVYGHVAAVCVYPTFVRLVADQFSGSTIKTATVVNFPEGADHLDDVVLQIGHVLQEGAQEVDLVFPYHRYLAGEQQYVQTFISTCKVACGEDVLLKVILETGALSDPAIIADAAYDVLSAGADFVKTSTGKIAEGATLEAVATLLMVIKHITPQVKRQVGCKVSGGIRSLQQAAQYLQLADRIMGPDWVMPDTFRIGASKLIDEIMSR